MILVVLGKVNTPYFEYTEVKGLVISEYQDKLDQDFISELRNKHKIKKNKRVLKQVVNDYN